MGVLLFATQQQQRSAERAKAEKQSLQDTLVSMALAALLQFESGWWQ
jgi:hypothetical protein